MAYLTNSFIENKRKETLYERVKDVLLFPENNKISSPFLSNKHGHKLYQTREYFDFSSLMHIIDWNVNIQRRLLQNEPFPFVLASPDTPPGVSRLFGASSPFLPAMMAPVYSSQPQHKASDLEEVDYSPRQNPALLVEDEHGYSNLDFDHIISLSDLFGFDTKISINSTDKLIDYEFSHTSELQPSEGELRKEFYSNSMYPDISLLEKDNN